MKYRYTKFVEDLLDGIDMESLVSQLSDLLLSSGFNNPWDPQNDDDRSMQALHDAILDALLNGGALSEEMLDKLAQGERGESGEAARDRIAIIHQELNLFTNLTIAENIFLSGLPRRGIGPLKVIDRGSLAERTREELQTVYDLAYATYTRLVEEGVARELARSVLPVGAYTEFYWTVNARALMNFVSLRAADTAQREIRRYAEACERFLAEQMPITHAAFVANDRTAP